MTPTCCVLLLQSNMFVSNDFVCGLCQSMTQGFACVIKTDQNSLKGEKRTPLNILSRLPTVSITDVTLTRKKLLIVAS